MISKSPQRFTFQKESYIKRMHEQNEPVNENYIDMFDKLLDSKNACEKDPKWQENNLEYDLRTNKYILEKVRNSDDYAKDLYRALCNNLFQKLEIIPILKEETWSCSWRYAGGIIADMKEVGDYIDWYCSGHEGVVTEEVEQDLKKLGWIVIQD